MPAKRKDQVLINKNFLMILFALLIILIIVTAVLLGVVVSDKRADNSGEGGSPAPVSDSVPDASSTTLPTPSATAASASGTYTVNTNANSLNVRAKAESDGEIITQIPRGTQIIVTEVRGEWGYTTYNGASGWVKMSFLVAASPTAANSASLTGQTTAANNTAG